MDIIKNYMKRGRPSLDPRKDFRFFLLRSKVRQVYREALLEARSDDPSLREQLTALVKEDFQVFRRGGEEVDAGKIEYELALIRKQINMIRALRERAL